MHAMKKIFLKALTTEMRCNGSKPCQGHIKRQHSGKKKCWKMVTNSSTGIPQHIVMIPVHNLVRSENVAVASP